MNKQMYVKINRLQKQVWTICQRAAKPLRWKHTSIIYTYIEVYNFISINTGYMYKKHYIYIVLDIYPSVYICFIALCIHLIIPLFAWFLIIYMNEHQGSGASAESLVRIRKPFAKAFASRDVVEPQAGQVCETIAKGLSENFMPVAKM